MCDIISDNACPCVTSLTTPQYASEDAELLLVGNKLDCEADREISRQQGEKVRECGCPAVAHVLVTRSECQAQPLIAHLPPFWIHLKQRAKHVDIYCIIM